MRDASYFTRPVSEWQRRYEALRVSFVDRLPAYIVAERFGFSAGYVRLLRYQFRHEMIDFSEPPAQRGSARRRVSAETRRKIIDWRQRGLSGGDIAELLSEDGIEISVRTVERVLADEGIPKLPRRTKLKIGLTVKGTEVPERAETISLSQVQGRRIESAGAGVFVFVPFIVQLGLPDIVKTAGLPQSKAIAAENYFLSLLALKLLGTERYAHVADHSFDAGLGLFAGLTVIPKCTALSTYSYSIDEVHLRRLQEEFVKRAFRLGLYEGGGIVNLDFHTVPHFGDESVLQEHWAGARGKRMKSALTLFAQDTASKLILYTAADIHADEADEQVFAFLSFWKKVRRGLNPTLIFDSKFTTYGHLSELNHQGVKFITLRRRGHRLIEGLEELSPWKRITIPHDKRKYPNPMVHESRVELRGYQGTIRQIAMRANGHDKPAFFITNDWDAPTELVVGNYARRWRLENGIAEAVKFFHLNALSSPILIKVHLDVIMTMIADTLYSRIAMNLRGFERCDAPKLYRHFIQGKAVVYVKEGEVSVTFSKRAHNPILRAVPWHRFPREVPWLNGAKLSLHFQ